MWKFILMCLLNHLSSTLIDDNQSISYGQLIRITTQHGMALKSTLPLKSKCAVLCDTGLNTAIGLLSCWYADLVAIPMSKNYGTKHCEEIIALTQPDIIITDNDNLEYRRMYNLNTKVLRMSTSKTEVDSYLDDVAVIMCTSGTTGKPKGAMITEKGLIKNVEAITQYFSINNSDTILIARPLYHCAVLTGEFLVSLLKGVNVVFCDTLYNPMSVIDYIEKHNISTICGTPTLFNHISQFLIRKNKRLSIRKISLSGECLSSVIARNIRYAFPDTDIYNVYGLTEASPRVSYLPPDKFDSYSESVGISINDVYVSIVDSVTYKEINQLMNGVVMVSSPSMMKGYYNNQELTSIAIKNGWLNTGDIGHKDKNGYLYILSRTDDMIIKAGLNIYPKEIENIICSLTEISECLAYGEKSVLGQKIVVDVVLSNTNSNINIKTLLSKFEKIFPTHLMPSKVNIVNSLVKNASGKLVRYKE